MSSEGGVQILGGSSGQQVQDHSFTKIYLDVCEKMRGFWERKNGEQIWKEEGTLCIVNVKTDLICFYLQLGYYEPIIYSIFLDFIIL